MGSARLLSSLFKKIINKAKCKCKSIMDGSIQLLLFFNCLIVFGNVEDKEID